MNGITRRQLAAAMLASTAAAQAPAPSTPAAELQAARDQNRRVAETLDKAPLPPDTEPAFHYSS